MRRGEFFKEENYAKLRWKNNLVRSSLLEKLTDLEGELDDPVVKHITVGKLPYKGDEVIVNGLRYKVIKRDRKDRQLILELL